MKLGRSYKQHPIEGSYDAIVIGSGIGGLAFAALAAKHAHQKVLVLERHYTAGGFTHTFHRSGFEWDVGVHYIGEVHREGSLLRRMFDDISDGSLEWEDMGEVFDTVIVDGERYELVKGRRAMRERLHGYFPDDRDAIDGYFERVQEAVGTAKGFFMEKAMPRAVATVIGGVMRRKALKHSRKTTLDVLRELTDNPRLIAVLAAQYGDYGLPPAQSSFFIHAMVAHHYFGGAAYPVGGSARIAETIIPVIERAGGAVYTNAEVAEVVIEGKRAVGVRLADGSVHRAPVIVSDAGYALTFGRLVPQATVERLAISPQLSGTPASVSHISLYVGLNKTAEELGLARSNLWIYPGNDHDSSVSAFVDNPDAPLPVAYVSFPSAKDPTFQDRYPGKATIEVVTLAPYEWFAAYEDTKWKKRGEGYDALKARLHQRLLDVLLTHCPQIAAHIEHAELSTPLSTKTFAAHPRGEIYGLAHTPERFEHRELRPETPIKGLFLTGADICSCGIGGALMGGVLTASAAYRKNILGIVARSTRRAG